MNINEQQISPTIKRSTNQKQYLQYIENQQQKTQKQEIFNDNSIQHINNKNGQLSNQKEKQSSHSQHVVIVSNLNKQQQKQQQIDPLQQEILSMKITQNLIKQISFSSSINKFQNLQTLLHQKHNQFNHKINNSIAAQKDIIKTVKIIQNSALNIDIKKVKKLQENKLSKDVKDIILAKQQAIKYKKLSYGMISALQQIQKAIDQKIKIKQSK